ncbi:MAG: LysM peptidoglycan-binding domain-containing protein [Myxococcales bacterium]|jgi:hypothetical protein
MKLVGWTSMAVVMMAGIAFAQSDVVMTEQGAEAEKVQVPADMPEVHTVVEGDTLWDITGRYYGDPYQWPRVWSYNPDITNPHWIYPGTEIRLRPSDEEVVKVAPRGFKRSKTRAGGEHAIYMAEYGFLDKNALQETGYIIAANEENMMLSDYDQPYVRFHDDVQPEVGKVYTIFRTIEPNERFRTIQSVERESQEKGTLVRIVGELRLKDYDQELRLGRAVVINALDPVVRGLQLAPLERRFYWVDVVPAEHSLRATVVASLYPRKLPSTDQIVFVDAGSEQGVVLGNRFYIVRQGDEWRRSAEGRIGREIQTTVPLPKPPKHYPWEVVAIGRAVNVQPTTTAVLLEQATRAVRMGDRAELREGE